MSIPSVEFNFSINSETFRNFPPSSSQDGGGTESVVPIRQASSVPRTLPTAQPPISLFQNLQPAHKASPNATPQRKSLNSPLSPGPSPSTYANQHNASPSPSPRPMPMFSFHRSENTRDNTTESSDTIQDNEKLNDPGLNSAPVPLDWGTGRENVSGDLPTESDNLSEAEKSEEDESETERIVSIREETLPRARIYNSRLQRGLKDVKRELAGLAEIMHASELAKDQSTNLYALCERTEKMSKFEYPETRTVGFIGDSGVGKSSLVNSLLDQKIARSSREGSACTCVVTEFRHTDDNHTGPFRIEAEYMNKEEMTELIDELLVNFRQFYVSSIFRELKTTEEQQNCRDAAAKAWESLQSLFKDQPELTIEFLSDETDGARSDTLAQLEQWASAGLAHRQGGSDALEYSATAGDIEECQSTLDQLAADSSEAGGPALWPFIKLIRVYLSSPILRTGLVLTDLPGLRDLNFARVRTTEKYLAHHCDEVFIVANIARASSDESVADIISRCRSDQLRRIICTNSENVSAEEAAREQGPDGRRVREMNQEIEAVKASHRRAKSRRIKADRSNRARWALEESELSDRTEELEFGVKSFLINRRNLKVSRDLARKYEEVQVFCVSNTLYSDHRAGESIRAEEYLDLTGIRELRRHCQLVPAEAQMRATSAFLEDEVPAMVGSLRQWALSGTDSVTAEKAAALHRVLNQSQEALCRDFQSSQAHVPRMIRDLRALFHNSVILHIRDSRGLWKQISLGISREWAGWHHATYAAFCRQHGSWSTKAQPNARPWNDQLVQQSREELDPQWEEILEWLESQAETLANEVDASFEDLFQDIHAHEDFAPQALQNILRSMRHRQQCIKNEIARLIRIINMKTQQTQRDMLYAHSHSFVSTLILPAYSACNSEGGTGSDRRRKQHMDDHLRHSRLFSKYSERAKEVYNDAIDESSQILQQYIDEQIQSIIRDFNAVVAVEGELPEAERDPSVAGILRSLLDRGQTVLDRAISTVRELNRNVST
ncbi:hypothetical protein N7457_003552 [Penicillium paradoxum]|uniref:uncharacterized protein n=1 Tax=Penicillium paradoxum TaxID=176176 RepID=UPI002548589E|nr:uncharacterized protein N7457_003552 [Penicillium paradoxum]KAJ5788562.1 hypothetical protein N7457_003552 [Penicillium paradoxum]